MSTIQGKVVKVLNPMEAVINLGTEDGVNESSRFVVFALGEEMKDPDTGESLGQLEIVRGRAEVKHAQEKMSTIRSIETKKETRDRQRPRRYSPFASSIAAVMGDPLEVVTEVVDVPAPFEGVREKDLVRLL